ncbi:hypothetical protein SmJEL517_g01405 [Synchytrium microbalum]|uniref:TAFII55 protein conserved region domain-containing protein n=1 Tax=Synchytrium microbalum TaxID=1806994 RepID=A0A507CEC1_9FUNG|nr:uncharacterized protein SmJEL517_g01405 [Synchytrium microbalum]TPX36274.1 hypothetical protein SmJEL517_g01405 [Synchytrium microbalum]
MSSLTALIKGKAGTSGKIPTLKLLASGKAKEKHKKRPEAKPKEDGVADDFIEDHMILRLPPDQANKLRSTLRKSEAPLDLSFFFYDTRKAVITYGKEKFRGKVVDLPCIIEAHKTYDNRQFYKISDICQMLVVEGPIQAPDDATILRPLERIKDFRHDHGLTPPMHWVRKRRFRPRMPISAIEEVEKQVIRLLEEDLLSEEIEIGKCHKTKQNQSTHALNEGLFIELRFISDLDQVRNDDDEEEEIQPLHQDEEDYDMDYAQQPDNNNSYNNNYAASFLPQQIQGPYHQQQYNIPQPASSPVNSNRESDDEDEEDDMFDAAFDEAFEGGDDDDNADNGSVTGGDGRIHRPQSETGSAGDLEQYEEVEIQFDERGENGMSDDEFEQVGDDDVDGEERDQIRRDIMDLQSRVDRRDQEIAKTANPILLKRLEDERRSMADELNEKKIALSNIE